MNDLLNYNRTCKDTIGKLKRVYLAKFVDYDETQILTNNGVITSLPTTIIYKFDVEGSYNQSTDNEGGAISWKQDIQINLNKVYNVMNPAVFANQKFRVIAESNNGYYLMFGLLNGLDCSLSNSSGTEKDAFNGFALTFDGLEEEAAMITDINDYTLFDEELYFSYNFNFNI